MTTVIEITNHYNKASLNAPKLEANVLQQQKTTSRAAPVHKEQETEGTVHTYSPKSDN